jgi:hypothetical protein
MKLRTAIAIIKYATLVAALLSVLGFIVYLGWLELFFLNRILVFMVLQVLTAAIILGKQYWLRNVFQTIRYPGLLYGVCEQLGYLRNLVMNASDKVLDDLYKPTYDTNEFLLDNNLSPEIYPTVVWYHAVKTILLFGPLFAFAYLVKVDTAYRDYAALFVIALLAIGQLISSISKRKAEPGVGPLLIFSSNGLQMVGVNLEWNNVYDWKYIRKKSKGDQTRIEVSVIEPVNEQRTFTIPIRYTTITYVECLILLSHYKYKYGANYLQQ